MEQFIKYVAPFGVLLPIIAGIIYYAYLDKPQRIIFYYVLYSALGNAVNLYIIEKLHQQTIISFVITSIGWVAFLSCFYASILKGRIRTFIYAVIFLYAVFAIVNMLYIQKHHVFNTYTVTFNAIIMIIYAMTYVYRQNTIDIDTGWGSNSINWINSGLLLYYSTALVMYVSFSFITTREFGAMAFTIHNIALITMYVLFVIGFKKCKG